MTSFQCFVFIFLVFAMAERLYEHRYSHRAARGVQKMEWSFAVFHTFHVIIYIATAVETLLLRPDPQWIVTSLAVAAFVAATAVRLLAIRTLGRLWSLHLEIREEHQLITTGIYGRVRHPAYAAIMVEVSSLPLVGNAYWVCAFALVAYIPLLLVRWRREEQEMLAKFGETYEQYRRSVPAFIPRLWKTKHPEPTSDIIPPLGPSDK
ncbi:MAG: isoprenylcysteine carboxylmethyltransferase family protein [Verrucomicrobiae bacterium]|nr:isoprenylcysteine carboxylmethyltransferase family protein [Verrucomicrobiae bacterium]